MTHKTTDYCHECGESPDSGSHLPHGHAYVPPKPFAVVDKHGAGRGRFATYEEAKFEADNHTNPAQGFEVFERVKKP